MYPRRGSMILYYACVVSPSLSSFAWDGMMIGPQRGLIPFHALVLTPKLHGQIPATNASSVSVEMENIYMERLEQAEKNHLESFDHRRLIFPSVLLAPRRKFAVDPAPPGSASSALTPSYVVETPSQPGCTTQPVYGVPSSDGSAGDKFVPLYCAGHKKAGMVSQKRTRCMTNRCYRRASYGSPGGPGRLCVEHKVRQEGSLLLGGFPRRWMRDTVAVHA